MDLRGELHLYIETLNYGRKWKYIHKLTLSKFLEANRFNLDKRTTIEYLSTLKKSQTNNYYRKNLLIIKSFLRYLAESVSSSFDFYKVLNAPREIHDPPKHVTIDDLNGAIGAFRAHKFYPQINALLLLGAYSGARAEELYQLRKTDIDLDRRILYIKTDATHTVKTGNARVTFFNNKTRLALMEYYTWLDSNKMGLNLLFGQSHLTRILRNSPVKTKDLRKFFIQHWSRQNGNSNVCSILTGHSIGSVDIQHYLNLNTDELKQIYDQVIK